MKRARAVTVLTLLALLPAAPIQAGNALFVTSAPIGAQVLVNGSPAGPTPLLLRGLGAGALEVTLVKPGYRETTVHAELGRDEATVVAINLEPDVFVASFSAAQTVVDGRIFDRQGSRLELPSGTYELRGDGAALVVTPVYPREGALRTLRAATIVGVFASLLATVEDVLVGDGQSHLTSFLPTPATVVAWTATATAGGLWWALAAERRRYERRTAITAFDGEFTEAEAERRYREAEAALEAGNLPLALAGYTAVVTYGRDSEYVPRALYRSAQIHGISGEVELASRLYEVLLRDYPAPEVYDRSLKSLADLAAARGDRVRAIELLDLMLFVDPLFERTEIEALRREIEAVSGEIAP